ncbi:MAG: hypothetical protein QOI86_2367 [Actinomycetota bacterium]|jgi:hypothetical protein|nr:hypothetical protein [Actinomycetota bacterium]
MTVRGVPLPKTLITGAPARASEVAAALQQAGATPPLQADSATALVDVCASVPPGSLDCYIQLPYDHRAGATAVADAAAMVADGGLARYDAVTTVVPLLSDGATVVLVMEERGDDQRRLDLAGAADDLTRLLARALRDDHPAAALKIALVGDRQSPSDIATIARLRGKPRPAASSYVDVEPGLGFADWRCQVLSLLEAT